MIGVLSGLLGADPRRVEVLVAGLGRSGEGYEALQRENGKGGLLDPRSRRVLLIVLAALASIFMGAFVALDPARGAALGVVVVILGGILQLMGAFVIAPSLLLADDDAAVVGHWPVTARDVAVARLFLLARPLRDLGVAFGLLPCALLAVLTRPPLVLAVATIWALLLQGVFVLLAAAAALLLLRRAIGLRRAQRVAGTLSAGIALLFLAFVNLDGLDRVRPWLDDPRWMAVLPPAWFAAWPLLVEGLRAEVLALAGIGLVVAGALGGFSLRILVGGRDAERVEPASGGWPGPGRLLEFLFAPWLRGSHGRVMRRLASAHLRDDGRFVGELVRQPLLVLVMLIGSVLGKEEPVIAPVIMLSFLTVMSGSGGMLAASKSSRPEALWVVASSGLSARGWAGAQRGLVRAMLLGPLLLSTVLLLAFVEAGWVPALDTLIVVIALFEISVRAAQLQTWRMSFSQRPAKGDFSDAGVTMVFALLGLPVVLVWVGFVHTWRPWGTTLSYAVMLVALVALARAARRREERRPLPMDVAVAG